MASCLVLRHVTLLETYILKLIFFGFQLKFLIQFYCVKKLIRNVILKLRKIKFLFHRFVLFFFDCKSINISITITKINNIERQMTKFLKFCFFF
jgi:hypothetical protein